MTIADLEHFRNLLLERQNNVVQWLTSPENAGQEEVDKVQNLLTEIKDALERVEHKDYGVCTVCEGEIEHHRLEIQPTAQICLECISQQERNQLEEELFLASKIHRALLPQTVVHIDGFDLAVKSLAARIVGGDYYDFFTGGRSARIVIADAMGKGLPAGLLMSNIQGALKILADEIESPSQLVTRLNRWLCRNVPVTKFVSFVCIALDSGANQTSRLLMANAGHCPPIIVRKGGAIELLEPTGGVLGVHEQFVFSECAHQLQSGDLLVLYTDGVTDAENGRGEMFGDNRLLQFLSSHPATEPNQLVSLLMTEIDSFAGRKELSDDLTIIALRRQ